MNEQDRQAIEQLFQRLTDVEKTAAPRDAESEALIGDFIQRRPQAAYYMAQTIIVQQKALEEAERRPQASDGYDSVDNRQEDDFTSDRMRSSGSGVPQSGKRFPVPSMADDRQAQAAQSGGGGFLAGAAQTAVGVAGGLLLGSAIGSMLGMGGAQPAQAAEPAEKAEPQQETPQEETEMADAGADSGGEGGGFWDSLFGGGGDAGDLGSGDF